LRRVATPLPPLVPRQQRRGSCGLTACSLRLASLSLASARFRWRLASRSRRAASPWFAPRSFWRGAAAPFMQQIASILPDIEGSCCARAAALFAWARPMPISPQATGSSPQTLMVTREPEFVVLSSFWCGLEGFLA
jgi:hypothetical protein